MNKPKSYTIQRVGHSDYKTTLEIYTFVTNQMAKDMMNKLEEIGN